MVGSMQGQVLVCLVPVYAYRVALVLIKQSVAYRYITAALLKVFFDDSEVGRL